MNTVDARLSFFFEFNDTEPSCKSKCLQVRGKSGVMLESSEAIQEIPTLDFCQFTLASGSNPILSVSSSVVFESFHLSDRMT